MIILFICLCVCAFVSGENLETEECNHQPNPVAVTPSGRIRGSWMETRRGRRFQAYRGIRYAEPPVGPLRFQPPKLILEYRDEVDATEDGPACPMSSGDVSIMDEDCLRINVYTPGYNNRSNSSNDLLPVIVYIHAGAFVQYSGQSGEAGPRYLLDRDVVFVAINYRLGSLVSVDTNNIIVSVKSNLYRDSLQESGLPVVVYIHAGGLVEFSGRSVAAGPHYLLDRDVVFVAINYRIGVVGFLALGTKEAPGNNGFKDQVAALKWIQRNIASFGGDPGLVTIAGCSAGSLSVVAHLISPMSSGLFHRAIAISGSPTAKVPSPTDRLDLAVKQARTLDCPTHTPHAIYTCLNTKTWQELRDISGFKEFGSDPQTLWRTTVELDFGQERFLPEEPMDAIRAGPRNSVPFIISQTRDEFYWKAFAVLNNETLRTTMDREWDRIAPISFILPRENATSQVRALRRAYLGDRDLTDDADTAHSLGKLYGDAITAFPVHRLANLMCRHSKHPVWYYEFDYIGNRSFYEDPTTMEPAGVAHQDDLLYLLSLTYRFPTIPASDSEDSRMVDKMTAIWYNFARYGDPNPQTSKGDTPELSSLTWPAMTPDHREYLKLNERFSVEHKLNEDRFTLWDQLYPIQY